jgi:anti-anti-sigma factor
VDGVDARLRATADLAPALLWVSDPTGARTFHSARWCAFTGRSPEQEAGAGWLAGLHPRDAERHAAATATDGPWTLEYRLLHADGTHRWVREEAAPLPGGGHVGSAVEVDPAGAVRQAVLADLSGDADTGVAERAARLARQIVTTRLADQCSIVLVDPDGPQQVAAAAADPDVEAALAEPSAVPPVVVETLATALPQVLAHVTDEARPSVASAVVVPLVARTTVIGALALGRDAAAVPYGPHDLRLAEEVAERTALALDNALLLAEEAATAARLAQLQAATAELSAVATPQQVTAVAIRRVAALLGTPSVGVWEVAPDGSLRTADLGGIRPAAEEEWGRVPADAPVPVADAARTRTAIWITEEAEWRERYPHLADSVGRHGFPATGLVPLVVEGRSVGVIVTTFRPRRAVTDAERTAVLALAEQCAQALDRARLHDAEHGARAAAEAAAARLRALVSGLAAVVWEADAATGTPVFVSERAEDLLGHPVARWLGDPGFRTSLVDPRDRAAVVEHSRTETAAGRDHVATYRVTTADGRTLWVQDVVHVVPDAAGAPARLQGVMIDVTDGKRAAEAASLLADAGRILADPGGLDDRLAALVRRAAVALGGFGLVSLLGEDDALRHITAAPDRPELEPLMARAVSSRVTPRGWEILGGHRPVAVHGIDDARRRLTATDEDQYRAATAVGATAALSVSLRAGDEVLGGLTFGTADPARRYDDADHELLAELGRRTAAAIHTHRLRVRARQLQEATAALSAAGTLDEAARVLVRVAMSVLEARRGGVYRVQPDGRLRVVHLFGYPDGHAAERYGHLAPEESLPVTDAARTGEPVWLGAPQAWTERYPHLLAEFPDLASSAAAALPMTVSGTVTGAIGLTFSGTRAFLPDQREFALSLAAQAAQAFERAAAADERREMAETLQRSLLPARPPDLARLVLAQRYLPGAAGQRAGGDWYDVLDLDDGRVAVVVGDVVGQGASAAAVMGQLRSALSGYLLEGHPPARALQLLDRFSARVPGARASSAVCVVLDPDSGALCWARAGHPPPLVLDATGARYLDGATGPVLGVGGPFAESADRVAPGTTVLLFTDGLVERRTEVVDRGFDRLAGAAAGRHDLDPESLADALLAGALDGAGPADDVALVVARVAPAPLTGRLRAAPEVLPGLRRTVDGWTAQLGLDPDTADDVQLTLGEAAANAVEHAYPPGRSGEFVYALARDPDGAVAVRVTDEGSWREPGDPGFRGRGLSMIRTMARDVRVDGGPGGTSVAFRLRPPPPEPAVRPARPEHARPGRPGRVEAGEGRVALHGDLDLVAVREVRGQVLAAAGDGTAVDLAGVGYVSSAGVGLLVELARAGALLLAAPDPVRRVLRLSGVEDVLAP